MSEILFPIAISSELDVSGEERIHVANIKPPLIRPVFTGLATVILQDNPILYWKLNEITGDGVVDYSGYNRHGTM